MTVFPSVPREDHPKEGTRKKETPIWFHGHRPEPKSHVGRSRSQLACCVLGCPHYTLCLLFGGPSFLEAKSERFMVLAVWPFGGGGG